LDSVTTIKVRKSTTALLKAVSSSRGRRESLEQIILELLDQYVKSVKNASMIVTTIDPNGMI
jgi:oligoribonuclease (3'-5' exoribonuclease)